MNQVSAAQPPKPKLLDQLGAAVRAPKATGMREATV